MGKYRRFKKWRRRHSPERSDWPPPSARRAGLGNILILLGLLVLGYWLVFHGDDVRPPGDDEAPPSSVLSSDGSPRIYPGYESKTTVVKTIYDGDTIRTSDGEVVRYLGMDTPEMNRGKKKPDPGAVEATERNRRLVLDKKVTLLVHPLERKDVYGRTLAYILLADGKEYVSVNHKLVEEGHAKEAYGGLKIPPRIPKKFAAEK